MKHVKQTGTWVECPLCRGRGHFGYVVSHRNYDDPLCESTYYEVKCWFCFGFGRLPYELLFQLPPERESYFTQRCRYFDGGLGSKDVQELCERLTSALKAKQGELI